MNTHSIPRTIAQSAPILFATLLLLFATSAHAAYDIGQYVNLLGPTPTTPTIGSAPTASLTADPTSVTEGESSTLTWDSTNTTSCLGSGFGTGGSTSGSVSVSPTADTTYTVACTGKGGSVTDTVSITVTQGGGTPGIVFSDDFETGLDWQTADYVNWYTGSPKKGTHSVRLRRDGTITKDISLAGVSDVTVSFAFGAWSLDKSSEYATAEYYDGSTWVELARIGNNTANENKQLNSYSVDLPASQNGNGAFTLRFRLEGSGTRDYAYVDNVVIEGTTDETTPPPATTVALWDTATTPTYITENDPNAVELGVKFQSTQAGQVTGIRFYKGPQNTGTHTGSLYTSTGTLLARGTFTDETASGWQELTFNTPVDITANTTYVASYHTPTGYYSFDSYYFTNSYTNEVLTAPSTSTSGGNGVYVYGATPTRPVYEWYATNYWVTPVVRLTTQ
jgi:hypothetical protein